MGNFVEVEFPRTIGFKAMGGPTFNTTVNEGFSGFEQRNQNWQTSRGKWVVSLTTPTLQTGGETSYQEYIDQLTAMFLVVGGMAKGFRLKDHKDWTNGSAAQFVGTGDSATGGFQLIKTYSVGSLSYVRTIIKPITSQIENYLGNFLTDSVNVFVGGVQQVHAAGYVGSGSTTQYTLDETIGVIGFGKYSTFTLGTIVGSGTAAVYSYAALTGETDPHKNQQIRTTGYGNGANNTTLIITSVDTVAKTFTANNVSAIAESGHPAVGTIAASKLSPVTAVAHVSGNTYRYTYTTLQFGQTPIAGMRVTVAGMQNSGNNGVLYITSIAGGAGTFDVTNTAGVAESTSTGTAFTDWVPVTNAVITSTYQFHFPVRFDTDDLAIQIDDSNVEGGSPIVTWSSITLRELRMASGSQG